MVVSKSIWNELETVITAVAPKARANEACVAGPEVTRAQRRGARRSHILTLRGEHRASNNVKKGAVEPSRIDRDCEVRE